MTETNKALRVQVLVIGSGAGGATTANVLADRGFEVVVLEEGDRHGLSEYGQSPTRAMRKLYRNFGMTPVMGSIPIGYVEGRCLGGSTEINSGFWHRLPPEFLLRWKARFGLIDFSHEVLEPHFAWAEEVLNVGERGQAGWPKSTQVFNRGIEAMDWSAQEVKRAATGCVNTNSCSTGCPKGAKQGMSVALIPRAEALGVRFLTGCKVKLLLKHSKRITGVLAEIKREGGSSDLVRIDADYVFVCAGPTQTPTLLRRSGIKEHVGDSFQIHPMLKVTALFNEVIDAQDSVMPLLQVKEFWPDISFGGSFFSIGHLALNLADNWHENFDAMKQYRNMASYYVGVRGTGSGTVRAKILGDGDPVLKYELSDVDVRHLSQGLARLSTMLLAAGAKEVYPCVFGLGKITSELEAVRWLDESVPRSSLSLTTVHAFSTCPMGERADRCAADSFGKVHGVQNLFVNDASMLPDSPGINPQGTIMALAHRNAHHFADMHGH
ncbi:MAG: GMC family oxidoreductase [Cyanobacteria bacterium SZAS LIN-2]|nr:GMC family oxidoreductase [Cyanobacteria bacterium SZAS LIN-2]